MKNKLFTPPHCFLWRCESCSLKSILLLVAMLLVATSNSFAQASFETIDGIRYLIDSDAKTATVMPLSGDQKYSGDVVVPEKVKANNGAEYPVTTFGENAFQYCYDLKSITIPSSVTTLGNSCFEKCSGLTSITIPSSVTTLGKYCFNDCNGLKNITIPSSVTTLGDYCFQKCSSLTSIIIPSSVTILGTSCFYDCHSLTSIIIPSSVTSLGSFCFEHCSGLTSITIPSSVISLGSYCFDNCSNLIGIVIPSSVTSLKSGCFSSCSNMTCITIPSSVTELGTSCFENCTKLEQATFKGKIPDVKEYAGDMCILDNNFSLEDCSLLTTCIIKVPQAYLQDYKANFGSKYPYIYASKDDDGQGEDKPVTACATPTIIYSDGELQFASATDGAQYHYTITDADITKDALSEDGKVQLAAAYNITAYATADGYKQSDKATAVLYWVKANGNLESTSTNINQAKTRGIVATSHDGIVTLSGLDNGEEVGFYAADGKQIGSVKAIDGVASQAVSPASLVIAKIGGQAIKIAVR